jgi:3-phenylpropionate/trans-cinnamate dioxygenase ferredoxin reductase subunit
MSARQVIAIVGAGLAGARAAEALRGQGFDGGIAMFGAEAIAPYDRPPLSKSVLADEVDPAGLLVHPPDWYREHDVDLRLGCTVVDVDLSERRLCASDGQSFAFDKLLLATGARARRFAGCAEETHPNVFVLRTLSDATRLRARLTTARSVVVIGGGFIGAEVASSALSRGLSVTMIEAAEGPFRRSLGSVASAVLASFYRNQGVDLVTSVDVATVRDAGGGVTVSAVDGRRWEADIAVLGIGAAPADELASRSGLSNGNGVDVDACGRTTAPFVFAAGDVANRFEPALGRHIRPEHWQNAQNHAMAVARNMIGADAPFSEVPWFWSDQFSVNLQMAGLPHDVDDVVVRGIPEDGRFSIFYLSGSRVVAAFGMDNAREIGVAKRLIGRRVVVEAAAVADEGTELKSLLQG